MAQSSKLFRNLVFIIQKNGELDDDVAHMINLGWLKWKGSREPSDLYVIMVCPVYYRLKMKF